MASSLKSLAVHGVLWSFIERFSIQGAQFLTGIVMARLLTPNDYGIIGLLAIFMSISEVFIDGGFTSALIQKKNSSNRDFSTVFYINLGVSCICYLMLFAAAPFIADFYHQPILKEITRIYGLNVIINSLVAVNRTKLEIALDFKTLSKVSFRSSLISGAVGIYCAYIGLSVWAIVIQLLLNSLLNVIFSFYFVRWVPKYGFSFTSFRSLFAFGSKLLIASLISSVYTNLYSLVIGKKFTAEKLGYFTRANQFAKFTSSNIAAILSRVSFPLLSKIQDSDEKLISIYSKYIQISAFIVFPLILGLAGIAKPLILILLTEKWSETVILLQILVFAKLWDCVILVNLNLLKVKGRSDLLLRLEIFKKCIAFIILVISMNFSLKVICLGLVLYAFVAFYMNAYYTKKLLNYGFSKQIREIFPYFLFSALISIEAYFLTDWIVNPFISILASLILCPITYLLLCYIFRVKPLIYVIDIIRQKYKHNNC